MRLPVALMGLLLLVGCAGADSTPAPTATPTSAGPVGTAATPGTEPAASTLPSGAATHTAPAQAPTVQGAWVNTDAAGMITDAEIDAAQLPDTLKTYLKGAVLDVVTVNEDYEEASDCPVEATVAGTHPAGFAVISVTGCGPEEFTGVVATQGDGWVPAVLTTPDIPACQELADAGVPGGAPYPLDQGLRCVDNDGSSRYW